LHTCRDQDVENWINQAKAALSEVGNFNVAYRGTYLLREQLQVLEKKPPCRNFVPVFQQGILLGLYLIKTTGDVVSTERFVTTDQITNVFHDTKDPLGVGVTIAYKFAPWNNAIAVAPFVSFDYLNASVNHTFPNGSFLGTTSNFASTAGVKVGPELPMGIWLYGIAGASVLNETLKVNFIPVASSTTTSVAGATVGFGGAFSPSFMQGLALPVSLFIEYQHTWWQDAQFNQPLASPFFNYNFRRQDDTFRFGFLVSLDAPPPPAPSYPVKAPRLK
jgi:hypothetical protein